MVYVIVTVTWLIGHGLPVLAHQRKNKDGSKVIIGYEQIAPVLTQADEENLTKYYWDSQELSEVLNSEEWSWEEEGQEVPVDTNFNSFLIIAAEISYAKLHINEYNFDNAKALQLKELYPAWESFFDKVIKVNTIVNYSNKLYKVKKDISVVLENEYPSITEELYELITSEEVSK